MKRFHSMLFLVIIFSFVSAEGAHALRCKGRLVFHGDSKFEVLATCGEPAWIEKRTIERIGRRDYGVCSNKDSDRGYSGNPSVTVVPIEVEEWLYNFGPHRLLQILRFENGVLVDIEDGDYGF